jgi:hypothetical protein
VLVTRRLKLKRGKLVGRKSVLFKSEHPEKMEGLSSSKFHFGEFRHMKMI